MKQLLIITLFVAFTACGDKKEKADASGSFEAEEVIISSEATGIIKELSVTEGQELGKGQLIGFIDSTQLFLKKKQLEAQIKAGLSQMPDIPSQLAIAEEQLRAAEKEKQRFTNLLNAGAATQKQLDDVITQTEVLKKQIVAQRSSLGITSESISEQALPLQVQIEQLNDQLSKCRIVNPMKGTVLTKYAEENETTIQGKALYKIADLSVVTLRVYVTGSQLAALQLNQKVKVLADGDAKKYKEYEGEVFWISDKAEFTPKTIQTKDERANMVYAVKIRVKNNGFLKLGMYAEVKF